MSRMTDREMTLSNYNPRTEMNGEKPVGAADLRLKDQCSKADLFHYFPSNAAAKRYSEFVFDSEGRVQDKLGKLTFKHELVGGKLTITHGLSKTPLEFEGVKVHHLSVEPIEGGACEVELTISVHPNEKQAGILFTLQRLEVGVTVVRAKSTAEEAKDKGQGDLELPVGDKKGKKAEGEEDSRPGRRGKASLQ